MDRICERSRLSQKNIAQTLAAFITSILTRPRGRLDAEEPPLCQIIDVLQQVMCTHDAEKLAISVLEIYEDSDHLLLLASPVGEK
jgi:hypothetical protein